MNTLEKIEYYDNRSGSVQMLYAGLLDDLKTRIEEVNNHYITPITLMGWVNSSIDVTELNELDESHDRLRNQVAMAMRALSVTVWNVNQDVNAAMGIIAKADSIRVDTQTEAMVREVRYQMSEIRRKQANGQTVVVCRACNMPMSEPVKKQTEFRSGVILILFILIAITVAVLVSTSSAPQYGAANMLYEVRQPDMVD